MSNINVVNIEDELAKSYLSYAMSVIIGRALPDVRDGLKPVHRRILYGMGELGNYFDKQYKKSARIVGDIIGKYHPHGELAVYDSIVRMVQVFVQRYNLIDGQGNFGSIDGDSAAAMRYTEIRLSEISNSMLNDLEFNTVDYVWNYDNTVKQPVVLPTILPNLLVNGASGIAVGMATNIPPHNIVEVINACVAFIDLPDIDVRGLVKYILGPDFPTYGIICGINGIIEAYETGKGRVVVRANSYIELNSKTDRENIIITELPYQINKLKVIEKITALIKEKRVEGIRTLRDESDKDGLRIFIDIEKGRNSFLILDKLYSLTQLQNIYNINMVALVNGLPKVLNLREIIQCFINHRKEVVYRRTNFKLKKAVERIHILEGLCVALHNIDVIINMVKSSKSTKELKNLLLDSKWEYKPLEKFLLNTEFDFSEKICCIHDNIYKFSMLQIQAILDLKLYRLTRLEQDVLMTEYECIFYNILEYKDILLNETSLMCIIKTELISLRDKFKDNRKTIIKDNIDNFINKNLVIKEDVIVTLSFKGYIKFQYSNVYNLQHRGGKGKIATKVKTDDYLYDFIIASTYDILLCFSNFGKVYCISLNDCSMSHRNSKGLPIVNLLRLKKCEKITVILPIKDYSTKKFVFMVTMYGFVKKILLTELKHIRVNGLIVIDLTTNDILVDVKLIDDIDEVILFASDGRALRFLSNGIRYTGRTSKGVIGMRLRENIYIVVAVILNSFLYVLTVVNNGYGKRTLVNEYPLTKRGGQGIIGMKVNKANKLVKVEVVEEKDELMIMTNKGILMRISVNEISCISRNTKGVVLMKLPSDEYIVSVKNLNFKN